MGTKVRKLLIGDLSNIQEYEEYFSDMSREGLHLQKVGSLFSYFRKGEPQYLNYRIDLFKKDKKEEVIEKRKRVGWDFVGERSPYLIFSSPENSHLKELYERPQDQKAAINAAKKHVYGGGIINIVSIVTILFIILIFYQKITMENGFYLFLVRESLGISIIVPIISFIGERKKRRNLEKLEKILDSNEFLKHHGDYPLMRIQYIIGRAVSLIIILFIVATLLYQLSQEKPINLGEIDDVGGLPIITIDDIERATFSHDGDGNYGHTLYQRWSCFIPKEYTLIESVRLYDDNQKKLRREPQLILDYYQTRFDFIAEGLEENILSRENRKASVELHKINTGDNSSCYGMEEDNFIALVYRKERQIIFLNYFDGEISLKEMVRIVTEKLDSYE